MALTLYSWDDADAPEQTIDNEGSRSDIMREILKACLVDGYGVKPAAGWTLIGNQVAIANTQVPKIALENARQTGTIRFAGTHTNQADSASADLLISVFDSMSDIDSGINGFGGDAAYPAGTWKIEAPRLILADNLKWYVIANEHACCFIIESKGSPITTYNGYNGFFYFGEYLPLLSSMTAGTLGNFITMGAKPSASPLLDWGYGGSNLNMIHNRKKDGSLLSTASSFYNSTYNGDPGTYADDTTIQPLAQLSFFEGNQLTGMIPVWQSLFHLSQAGANDNLIAGKVTGTIANDGIRDWLYINNENPPYYVPLDASLWPQ